jgi:hypothetical protein
MPVLFAWFEPDDIAWADVLNRAALTLDAAKSGGHDQNLSKRMRMPGRPRSRFECDGVSG